MIRLGPYLASRTSFSRRQAEQAIRDGRVRVNGRIVDTFMLPEVKGLMVDGCLVPCRQPDPFLWAYNKPRGQLVTRTDPQGRPTVFDALASILPAMRLVAIGRLDYDSQGLLLITNSPALAHTWQTSRVPRTYHVWIYPAPSAHLVRLMIQALAKGMCVQGIQYRPAQAQWIGSLQHGFLKITLDEGKNREIRLLMKAFDSHVTRLKRMTFGPFVLGTLQPQQTQPLPVRYP